MLKELKKNFMLESNMIEREYKLNPGDLAAVDYALTDRGHGWCHTCVQKLHGILGAHLSQDWVGRYRDCQVRIGRKILPHQDEIHQLMENFFYDLKNMDSWEAHNEFEMIHPFQDLNGRVGRLIWLSKAVGERYALEIPFLQMYYYQTLTRYED